MFVEALKKEFKDNKTLNAKPLTAVVTGLKNVDDFDEEMMDSYRLEVVGGNHRRVALQGLFPETSNDEFKWASVLLYTGKQLYPNFNLKEF